MKSEEEESLAVYAEELNPVDNLFEANESLKAEVERLRAENDSLRRAVGKWQADFEDSAREAERLRTVLRTIEDEAMEMAIAADRWRAAAQALRARTLAGSPTSQVRG